MGERLYFAVRTKLVTTSSERIAQLQYGRYVSIVRRAIKNRATKRGDILNFVASTRTFIYSIITK